VREICTLGAMWRGLETGLRLAIEALPEETGRNKLGLTYGTPRQSSTRPALAAYVGIWIFLSAIERSQTHSGARIADASYLRVPLGSGVFTGVGQALSAVPGGLAFAISESTICARRMLRV
jgi:hypothetical protein